MADQSGFPLRLLIEKLQLKVDPELARVEALASQVQQHRRETTVTQEEVSRTSILHACGLIQPTVFLRLSQAGFDRGAWEQAIRVQDAHFEVPLRPADRPATISVRPDDLTQVLERYAAGFPRRPLDALGLAWAIAATPPQQSGVGARLRRAGLNWEAADALLAEAIAADLGLVPIAGLDRYRVTPVISGALEKAKELALERGSGTPLTASLLLLGLAQQGSLSAVDDTTTLLWKNLQARNPNGIVSIVDEYLSWYGERQQPQETAVRWMTYRVGEIFERARDLSVAARRRSLINARSLLGAILAYRPPEGRTPLGAHLLLEQLGSSVEGMIATLLDYLRTNAPEKGGDDLEAWEGFFRATDGQESGPANVARIDTESLGGKDLLRIDNDVTAFALLLASANLTPPLAIGLFGNWGAGKSFFMKKLFERIEEIARKAEKERLGNRHTPFHGQIVQIELNAWHYEEASLWASMVTHIFESLHRHFAPREEQERKRWAELLKKLSEDSLSQDGARTALAQAEEDLEQAHKDHEANSTLSDQLSGMGVAGRHAT